MAQPNAFDDIPTELEAQAAAAAQAPQQTANAFDDLTPAVPTAAELEFARRKRQDKGDPGIRAQFSPDAWGTAVQGLPSQLARAASGAATALPGMAMDFGVGARNLYSKVAGDGTQYEYPSETMRRGTEALVGAPANNYERAGDIASSVIMGGQGANAATPVVRAMSGAPDITAGTKLGGLAGEAATVPDNFITQSQGQKYAQAIRTQDTARQLQEFQGAGLVVPPATTNPTLGTQALETGASKIGTQQAASIRNHETAQRLASADNGADPNLPLVKQLPKIIADSGQDYQSVRGAGAIPTDSSYRAGVQAIRDRAASLQKSFPGAPVSPVVAEADALLVGRMDAGHGLDMNDRLRDLKSTAYKNGDTASAKAYGELSKQLEGVMDRSLNAKATQGTSGVTPGMVSAYKAARQRIAIAKTTQDAMDGDEVSLAKLGKMYNNDEYLSGNLDLMGRFGAKYAKSSQLPSKLGSAGVNHLEAGSLGIGSILAAKEGYELMGIPGAVGGLALAPGFFAGRRALVNTALGERGQRMGVPKFDDPQAILAQDSTGPTRSKAARYAQAISEVQRQLGKTQ